jgi:hypothetical protein
MSLHKLIYVGEFQRFKTGPALVHKLDHHRAVTPTFDKDVAFYTSNFNFGPSDVLHAPGMEDIGRSRLMHLDLGADYSDHHSLFFQRG